MSALGQPRAIDKRRTPSNAVGQDERRACADKPTWQWFALPFERHAESRTVEFDGDDLPFKGGDDTETRKAGHQRALVTCASCPLVLRCLQSSWTTEEYGTYGAVSEVERFYLGGRGRSTSQPRTVEKYDKILGKIAQRFGSPMHPVVRWITAQGLPRGLSRPVALPEVEDGAA